MLSLFETQIKAAIGGAVTWPIRWKGENWPSGTVVSDGNMPMDGDGGPAPAIEAEVSGFSPSRAPGRPGQRRTIAEGHIRLILSMEALEDTGPLTDQFGLIDAGLARTTIYHDALTARRIYFMDARIESGGAFYEEGNRTVRMVTIPWFFTWIS